jgi:crotonobetainyl-CoA:carnitine CoA-transferase CaiB-like acyl-CoA transferase
MLLGDLGADVAHVQTVAHDPIREPGYVCWHRNKTVVRLSPNDPGGGIVEIRRLLAAANLVICDWPRSELERLRLDGVGLRADRPHLVHVWMPAYGTTGKWSELGASSLLLAAVSGLADNFSAVEDRPVAPVVPLVQYQQGTQGAVMAVAGLLRQRRSGAGDAIVVSGLHATAAMLAAVLLDCPGINRPARRERAPFPHFSHYQCADGEWLYLAALAQPFFLRTLDVMDLMDVMVMPGIDGEWLNLQLSAVNGQVIQRLDERFAERSREEWLKLLTDADIPCAPIQTREQWFDSETVVANGLRARLSHRELGAVDLPAVPFTMSGARTQVRQLPDSAHCVNAGRWWSSSSSEMTASSAHEVTAAPLAGIRVLDLAPFVAGTFGPSILAFLGAEVVKIETADGDPYRDFSVPFTAYNQAKRGLGLNLKHADGQAIFRDLVKHADVVVDGARPSARARLGTDYSALRQLNNRLVRCSITGWGEVGPLAETPGFDPLLQARSGLMAAQGGVDDPVYVSMLVHDVGTGTIAALGILAALFQRESTGTGQEICVSLASSSTLYQSGELTSFDGRDPALIGSRDWPGPGPTERFYECADGWIAIAATDATSIAHLLDALDVTHSDELTKAFAGLTADAALDRLAVAGVDAAGVLPRLSPYDDAWLAENCFFRHFQQPGLGECTVMAGWSSWGQAPVGYAAPAPRNGEHTRRVLRDWGIDAPRIEAAIASGAAHETDNDGEVDPQ